MTTPARLYKYESFSAQSLENLKNQVIYFGSPKQFNDPYDCALFPSIKEPTDAEVEQIRSYYLTRADHGEVARQQFKNMPVGMLRADFMRIAQDELTKAVDQFLSQRGVSCFAERPDNLLMWSHYASHHRGFCLEFKTDSEAFEKARPVRYADRMPEFDLVRLLCDKDDDADILNLFCTKSPDWQYEREWRAIHAEAGTAFSYPAEALTGVYFGAQASFTTFEIAALILAGQNPYVQLWRGKRSRSKFAVDFDPVTYTPYLEAKQLGLVATK